VSFLTDERNISWGVGAYLLKNYHPMGNGITDPRRKKLPPFTLAGFDLMTHKLSWVAGGDETTPSRRDSIDAYKTKLLITLSSVF
jgi:hypothetical protein